MNYTVLGWQDLDERKLLQGCLGLAERQRHEKNHSLNNIKEKEKANSRTKKWKNNLGRWVRRWRKKYKNSKETQR